MNGFGAWRVWHVAGVLLPRVAKPYTSVERSRRMSTEAMPREAAHLAAIFQKAYARAVSLQRMDEQIAGLLEQRQKLESEFREVQDELNVECERMLKSTSVTAANLLAQMAESAGVDNANGNMRLARLKAAQAAR